MTIVETILGGIVISLGSISITHFFSEKNKIDRDVCRGIREDCKANRLLGEQILMEKIDNIHEKVNKIDSILTESTKNKLLGI